MPCSLSSNFSTVIDNQASISVETFKGENNVADNNTRLGKFIISDLPQKPAGQASITVTITITEQLIMIVRARSNDTGNEMEANYYDNNIAK